MSWRRRYHQVATGIALALLFAQPAGAAIVDTELLEPTADTLLAGLTELRDCFLDESRRHDQEHVGAVLSTPEGRFRFTHGIARSGQDRVRFRIPVYEQLELVGFWHTHGAAEPHRELFSPGDTDLVRETGLPFYLIDPAGNLRALRPEDVERTAASGWSAFGSRLRAPPGSTRGTVIAARREPAPAVAVAVSGLDQEV